MAFGSTTTTDEVLAGIDLTGKTAYVTGASAGLGVETVRALASAGAEVVMAARDPDKVRGAMASVRAAVPTANLETAELDLASLASVRAAAAAFLARHDRLDLLINNAGVMACPAAVTGDGFELQLGTNHLGHFLLTGLLTPALVAAAPARVVNLSSRGHVRSDIRWDDPHFRAGPYDNWEAYGQSKTANILFTVELDRRLAPHGVRSYAVHPGVIYTELSRHLTSDDLAALRSRAPGGRLEPKTLAAGAATSVWAATSPDLADTGGVYLEDCRVSDHIMAGGATDGHAPWALDPVAARRLWSWSEAEVGQAVLPELA